MAIPWEFWPVAIGYLRRIKKLPTWLVHNRRQVIRNILLLPVMLLCVYGIAWTTFIPWLQLALSIISALAGLTAISYFILQIVVSVRHRLSDSRRLNELNLEGQIVWSTICQFANGLHSERAQTQFFELLQTQESRS